MNVRQYQGRGHEATKQRDIEVRVAEIDRTRDLELVVKRRTAAGDFDV